MTLDNSRMEFSELFGQVPKSQQAFACHLGVVIVCILSLSLLPGCFELQKSEGRFNLLHFTSKGVYATSLCNSAVLVR